MQAALTQILQQSDQNYFIRQ